MKRGDEFTEFGVTYVVTWAGGRDDPSLLDNYPRPSTLALLVPDRRQSQARRYVATRGKTARPWRHVVRHKQKGRQTP